MRLSINFSTLADPVSEAEPCGPDLELAGDPDYMHFMARAEGLLPESFFSFDRSSVDFKAVFEAADKLLLRTRDIRVLTILAKFLALDNDFGGFALCMDTIGILLRDRWHEIHPRVENGEVEVRIAVLHTLDDLAPVVLPLQHIPLVEDRRLGPISYRHYLVATGAVKARANEQALDAPVVEKAFMDAELADLVRARDHARTLQGGIVRIQTACMENAGFEHRIAFDRLAPVAEKMLSLLDGLVAKRDPALALGGQASDAGSAPAAETASAAVGAAHAPAVPQGPVTSTADAAEALAAAAAYFGRSEPSSPTLLLVAQAQQLVGKSFVEVMKILVPSRVDQATIHIGAERTLRIPFEQLSMLSPNLRSDGQSGDEAAGAEGRRDAGSTTTRMTANTRREAVALLEQVAAYYRSVEPSSPIPVLLERASGMVERDFLTLLKDVLDT